MCGTGRNALQFFHWYASRFPRAKRGQSQLYLLDFSKPMLQVAAKKNYPTAPKKITLATDVDSIEWNGFKFKPDVVIAWWNLCFFYDVVGVSSQGRQVIQQKAQEKRLSYVRNITSTMAKNALLILCEPITEKPVECGRIPGECQTLTPQEMITIIAVTGCKVIIERAQPESKLGMPLKIWVLQKK